MRRCGALLFALLAAGCASSTTSVGRGTRAPASVGVAVDRLGPASALSSGPAADPATPPQYIADPLEAAAMAAEGAQMDAGEFGADEGAPTEGEAEIDDDAEAPAAAMPLRRVQPAAPTSPLLRLSDAEVRDRIRRDLPSLGPLSVGSANSGALVNGVRMFGDEHWEVIDPGHAWATQETIDYLQAAMGAVYRAYPDSQKMRIGHLSAKRGGKLRPHKSHQSGRDVDVSYYYKTTPFRWYRRATAKTLDAARTWTFVRALLTDTDAEWIFINYSVQKVLKEYALSIGEDPAWLDSVFQYHSRHPWPLIRHARGHDTHIHVRFYNPVAQELGRRSYRTLVAKGHVKPRIYHKRYKVRKGEILSRIARKFGTTVKEIQKANGMRSTLIKAGKVYLIPRKGQVAPPRKLVVPPRRLPPNGGVSASARVAAPEAQ